MSYADVLKKMGVKKIPKDILSQAVLYNKLKKGVIGVRAKEENYSNKSKYKSRGLQIRTWGNKGEGY